MDDAIHIVNAHAEQLRAERDRAEMARRAEAAQAKRAKKRKLTRLLRFWSAAAAGMCGLCGVVTAAAAESTGEIWRPLCCFLLGGLAAWIGGWTKC